MRKRLKMINPINTKKEENNGKCPACGDQWSKLDESYVVAPKRTSLLLTQLTPHGSFHTILLRTRVLPPGADAGVFAEKFVGLGMRTSRVSTWAGRLAWVTDSKILYG